MTQFPFETIDVYIGLRQDLIAVFEECGENCARAYYPPRERDANDHEASNALQILGLLVGDDIRDELREAYEEDKSDLSLYSLREGETSSYDRYAQVALRVAAPLLAELIEDEMGGRAT